MSASMTDVGVSQHGLEHPLVLEPGVVGMGSDVSLLLEPGVVGSIDPFAARLAEECEGSLQGALWVLVRCRRVVRKVHPLTTRRAQGLLDMS